MKNSEQRRERKFSELRISAVSALILSETALILSETALISSETMLNSPHFRRIHNYNYWFTFHVFAKFLEVPQSLRHVTQNFSHIREN